MERTEIAQLASKMENRQDLLDLLNRIKKDEMEENGLGDFYHPFTKRHINFYCNPNNAFHRYTQFKIKKKTGGFRQITAPRNRGFMNLLSCLNEVFKAMYTPSDNAMGFTEGRSVVTNASKHVGMNYVLNLDLKDFFPSIEQARVWKRLQLKPFNFPVSVANTIAGLCSMKERRMDDDGEERIYYVLPQGAPTSPIITNMICDKLDRRLAGLAKRFGLNYTRYADDITFSSNHNVYQEGGEFFTELYRIIDDQRFTVNAKKTRLQKLGARQEVTGIIVSKKVNVTQKYVRDIRNLLYIWDRYGYAAAYAKFFPKYKAEKGHVKKGNPDLLNVLDGKLMYLKMVKGEKDSVYHALYTKFKALVDSTRNTGGSGNKQVKYVDTIPLSVFEKKYNTSVVITMSDTLCQVTIKGHGCMEIPASKKDEALRHYNPEDVTSEKIIPARRYAYFKIDNKKVYASVNKSISKEEESRKDILAISNCRDANNKEFWLIHRNAKPRSSAEQGINIDELNNELDSLLNM